MVKTALDTHLPCYTTTDEGVLLEDMTPIGFFTHKYFADVVAAILNEAVANIDKMLTKLLEENDE